MDYAKVFAGSDGKFVIVEINPSDVVSIPSDCSGKKLRTCKYVVVEEYIAPLNDTYINTAVNTPDEYVADDGDDDLCQCDACREERGEDVADDGADDLCQCDTCREDRFVDEVGVKSKTITQNPNYHNKRDASGRFTKA